VDEVKQRCLSNLDRNRHHRLVGFRSASAVPRKVDGQFVPRAVMARLSPGGVAGKECQRCWPRFVARLSSATLRAYDTKAWAIDPTVIRGLPECPLVLQMAFVIWLEGGYPARSPLLA
jgi:hypothetical protein